jgi:hypothetical protein
MKITSKTLLVSLDNSITVHNDSVCVNVSHQLVVFLDNEGEINTEVEMMDWELVSYMGEPIKTKAGESIYDAHQRFVTAFDTLGIELNELVDDASVGLVPTALIQELEDGYRKMIQQ